MASRGRALTEALRRRIVPELRYSQDYYEEHLRRHVAGVRAWLDVGCGHHLLPPWRSAEERELLASVPFVVGVDYDFASLRRHDGIRNVIRADIGALPFRDQCFDLVTANMVVEHLSDPVSQFREVARVLRPGGRFLFHTPNLHGYPAQASQLLPDAVKKALARMLEGRSEEDVFPTYYRANVESMIRSVAAEAGLDLRAIHFTGTVPVFGAIPPLAAMELLYIRQLMRRPGLARYRQTLICELRRPEPGRGVSASGGPG